MKKRILFCIENFQQGGINKALENMLSLFDHERYEVGLFVVNQEDGPYKDLFAPYLKYDKDSALEAYCTYYHKHKGIKKLSLLAFKSFRKLLSKCGVDLFKVRLSKWAKRISHDCYDCVIAFAEGYITEFVSTIKGHKIAWIHIDYKRYLSYAGSPDESAVYDRFRYIVIPSRFSGDSFAQTYPSLKDKIRIVPNVLDSTLVWKNSNSNEDLDHRFTLDEFTIISVGRVCYEKRFYEIPAIARELKDKGARFKWYIIGDGSPIETATLNKAIAENNVANIVIPLGRKNNPYPYIAKSSLLVSTSLSETFSYVVFEAKSLGVPVVCADFGTAPEIMPREHGSITTIENMADEIYRLYSDGKAYETLKINLSNYSYDYASVLKEIYRLL